jgi:microcystin-dependent protein
MAEPFLGQIELFPYTFAPYTWTMCQGQLLSVSQYSALFSLIGTNFGGNGTSNFGLPNLQGQLAVGIGQLAGGSYYDMGETGGSATVALSTATIPPHTHALMANSAIGNNNIPQNQVLSKAEIPGAPPHGTAINLNLYLQAAPNQTLQQSSIVPVTGGGTAHPNMQPFLTLNTCIALSGVFPTRP